jgi:EpsI family protein
MNTDRPQNRALIVALVAVGGIAWWLQLQPPMRVDASALASLPQRIGPWDSVDIPLESAVESALRADFHIQRFYRLPSGESIWLYVGYYGTARGGRPEHTPRGCYTGAGWGIEASRTLELVRSDDFRVNEYHVERDGEHRLVHFWYHSYRRSGMVGGLDQNLDRLVGRLLNGRADGALVRISTPLRPDDDVSARGRLLSFATALDPLLTEHWPTEHANSHGS